MKLEFLEYIITTAQCSSITAAAERLYLKQTTLSAAIKNVETQTGITIFERSHNGITLTEDGQEFITLATEITNCWRQIEHLGSKKEKVHKILLLSHIVVSDRYGLQLMEKCRKKYPEDVFTIESVSQESFFESMIQNNFNVGVDVEYISEMPRIYKKAKNSGLILLPLSAEPAYLYVNAQKSPFAQRDEVEIDELKDEHLVISSNGLTHYEKTGVNQYIRKHSVLSNLYQVRDAVSNENVISLNVAKKDAPDWMSEAQNIKRIKVIKNGQPYVSQYFLIHKDPQILSDRDLYLIECIKNLMVESTRM